MSVSNSGRSASATTAIVAIGGRYRVPALHLSRARDASCDVLGRHARELTARDVEHLAVDEVGPRRAQEEDAAGRLLGGAGAPDGDERSGHPAHLLGDAELDLLAADLGHVGVVLG